MWNSGGEGAQKRRHFAAQMAPVGDDAFGLEQIAVRGRIASSRNPAGKFNDDLMAAQAIGPRISGGELAEAAIEALEAFGHFAPADMTSRADFAVVETACQPEAKLGALLQERISGSLHRPAERDGGGMSLDPC